MRHPLLLLSILALPLGACKPSVPESFDALVPTDHRDALTKVIEESENLKKPGRDYMILWYDHEQVTKADLYAAYRQRLEAAGYGLMIECAIDDPGSMTLAKAPKEAVRASFRHLADVWHTDLERSQVSSITLPTDAECEFTEHAESLCKSISGTTCFMEEL